MERKSFTDRDGRKGTVGCWVRRVETGDVMTVESITQHGHFGITLHAGSWINNNEMYVKAKDAVIVKTAEEAEDIRTASGTLKMCNTCGGAIDVYKGYVVTADNKTICNSCESEDYKNLLRLP